MSEHPASPDAATIGLAYRRFVVVVVFLVSVVNYVDRYVLSVMLEQIKQEFALRDTELGLLSGVAFAIFYSIAGLPFARWADLGNRRRLIAIGALAWSCFTMVAGAAQSFAQLLMARIGVALGEAAGTPASHSLLADLYPASSRAAAAAVFSTASILGSSLGVVLGGAFAAEHGWREALIMIGAPGILIALLAFFALPEPRTAPRRPTGAEMFGRESRAVIRALWSRSSYRYTLVGFTAFYFVQYGMLQWMPAYLIRSFSMPLSQVGFAYGVVSGGAALIGTILGGIVGNRLSAREVRWLLAMPAICCVIALPIHVGLFLAGSATVALVWSFMAGVLLGLMSPAVFAALYAIGGAARRATALFCVLFAVNLIGLGLGPLSIGFVSDLTSEWLGKESLRYALLGSTAALLVSMWCFWRGSQCLEQDVVP